MGWTDQPYAYAGNNPLTNVDPSGQRLMAMDGAVGSAAPQCMATTRQVYHHSGSNAKSQGGGVPPILEWALQLLGWGLQSQGAINAWKLASKIKMREAAYKNFAPLARRAIRKWGTWEKDSRIARYLGDHEEASRAISFLEEQADKILVAGFVVDAVAAGVDWYFSKDRPDITGSARFAAALLEGFVHAVISTFIVVFGVQMVTAWIDAAAEAGTSGLITPFLPWITPLIEWGAGFLLGFVAGKIADVFAPLFLDFWAPRVMPAYA